MGRFQRLSAAAIVAAVLVAGMAPTDVDAAKRQPLRVRAWLANTCVGGSQPKGTIVKVRWTDADGTIERRGKVKANKRGRWTLCSKNGSTVEADDKILVKVGKRSRTARVPRLTMVIDRETDEVAGTAPPNARMLIQLCYWRKAQENTSCNAYDEATAAGDGTYVVDFGMVFSAPTKGVTGGDRLMIFIFPKKPHKDLFGRDQLAPYVQVEVGSAKVAGAHRPGMDVRAKLWDAADPTGPMKADWNGKATGRKKSWSSIYGGKVRIPGLFSGTFDDGTAGVVQVGAGDRIKSPQIHPGQHPGFYAIQAPLDVDKASDVVSGSCASGEERYDIRVYSAKGSKLASYSASTRSGGDFSRDMTKFVDIKRGHLVTATCHTRTGDRVVRRMVVG